MGIIETQFKQSAEKKSSQTITSSGQQRHYKSWYLQNCVGCWWSVEMQCFPSVQWQAPVLPEVLYQCPTSPLYCWQIQWQIITKKNFLIVMKQLYLPDSNPMNTLTMRLRKQLDLTNKGLLDPSILHWWNRQPKISLTLLISQFHCIIFWKELNSVIEVIRKMLPQQLKLPQLVLKSFVSAVLKRQKQLCAGIQCHCLLACPTN